MQQQSGEPGRPWVLVLLFLTSYAPMGLAQGNPDSVVANSRPAFTLPERDAHIESIAYDARTRKFYLGAIHKRKIIERRPDNRFRDFATTGQDGLYAVLGLQADPTRRLLWACTTAIPNMLGYAATDKNKTVVIKYDLDTHRPLKTYTLADDGQVHILGEPLVARNGDVYISDSGYPAIYRIRAADDRLELFLLTPLESLQGIAFSADEQVMFIADYATGIHRCRLADKQLSPLQKAGDITDRGTDGLYVYHNQLIAIQNGLASSRVVRFLLDSTLSRIESMVPLETHNPRFNEPTLGVVVGDDFYYVANSQWGSYTKEGAIFPTDKLTDLLIMRVSLK